jgi:hypothetical protein
MPERSSTSLCVGHNAGLRVVKQVRFEDMSPTGRLEILRQEDGDVIVSVIQDDHTSATVEFCAPMTGGGSSERTWKALRALFDSMEQDNKELAQVRRFA